jgi:hypothetical protein
MSAAGAGGAAAPGVPTTPSSGASDELSTCSVERWRVDGLGLHLVVDESLAMVFPSDLWTPLGQALDAFVASEQSTSLSVGAQFFQGDCDPASYAMPDLPIAPAGQQPLLAETMSDRQHRSGAATALALTGALEHARGWASAQQQRAALVLISGSEPNVCFATGAGASAAAEAARAGLASSPPVATYVLALRTRASLEGVALAGGTGAALVTADPSAPDSVEQTLHQLVERAACEYALPQSAAPYVPDQINLQHTLNGQRTLIPRVDGELGCDAAQGGFYYDAPQNAARILTCPQSCERIKQGGEVEIILGCPSVKL